MLFLLGMDDSPALRDRETLRSETAVFPEVLAEIVPERGARPTEAFFPNLHGVLPDHVCHVFYSNEWNAKLFTDEGFSKGFHINDVAIYAVGSRHEIFSGVTGEEALHGLTVNKRGSFGKRCGGSTVNFRRDAVKFLPRYVAVNKAAANEDVADSMAQCPRRADIKHSVGVVCCNGTGKAGGGIGL